MIVLVGVGKLEMSKARVSVKWIFGDIVNYFKFTDF